MSITQTRIAPPTKLTVLGNEAMSIPVKIVNKQLAQVTHNANEFSRHLASAREQLFAVLSTYQSHATSEDEFKRIFECLDSIEEVSSYLTRRTGSVAVFFPLNMPVYALVLYGIFPAFVADRVYVRAPQRMTDLMEKLLPILRLSDYFPNIQVVFASREDFIQRCVSSTDVTIFTGKLCNAQYVLSKAPSKSLFLFNGWGCNPIVVGTDADVEDAAAKAVDARLFSSGQDCAGPDTILVHRTNVEAFTAILKRRLKQIRVGDSYIDSNVIVGPLADAEQVRLVSSILLKSNSDIIYGGGIDFKNHVVHPTIISCDLQSRMNFEELFAPVLFVNIYDDDSQLSRYFEHPAYIANEMYVTLFGQSPYVETLKKSVIIHNQVVFDIDRGNDEFGGYSIGASFVSANRSITPQPILIPRDIFNYLQPGSEGYKLTPGSQKKISKQVRKNIADLFGDNLVFGFVFGSVAQEAATGASDINTMVVVRQRDHNQERAYTQWLRHLHEQFQLTFKSDLSFITITLTELQTAIDELDVQGLAAVTPPSSPCLLAIHIEALAGLQSGVSGDKVLSVELGRKAMRFSRRIRATKKADITSLQSQKCDFVAGNGFKAEDHATLSAQAIPSKSPTTDLDPSNRSTSISEVEKHTTLDISSVQGRGLGTKSRKRCWWRLPRGFGFLRRSKAVLE